MAESAIMKTLNGRKVYDEDARKELENIKNAAPGLVFDTVAEMSAYVAENADTLKVGQDLFIRESDVPDYWWDGTAAVPVETELGEVKEQLSELSEAIAELGGTLVEPAEDDIPKVFFGGALQQTKDEAVVPFRYISKSQDIPGYAEIKAQGNSSMSYPKKNQTVKLFEDEACETKMKVDFKGWGKQNKYCFKANWIDISHARNVVSARLWGDIVKSRADYASLPELLRTSPNQGAVDGFPIKVYADGVYQGRYTLNIPKDKWTFNMDDKLDNHCVLCGEGYVSGCFREASMAQWTDEIHDVVPTAIKTRWLEVIDFVMNSTDDDFKAHLNEYIDVQSAIDYHLFGLLSCGMDAYGKNQLYITYDGTKWYASMYDMDSTWGLYWSGAPLVSYDYSRESYQDMQNGDGNLLYIRMEQVFFRELKARWEELKNGALSKENIINRFERFTDIAPAELVKEDYATTTADGKFAGIPSANSNNVQQIRNFAMQRMVWCDEYINALIPVVEIPCTGITLSKSNLTFTEKTNQTITATLTPTDTTDTVVWESSAPAVVTVENGVVTPVANGSATITATAGDVSAQCSVTVEFARVPCESITLNTDRLEFNSTEPQTIFAEVYPENTTDIITWESSAESVVTVADGVVTPVSSGTAIITVRCGECSDECSVTVNAESIFADASWSIGGINYSGVETASTGDRRTGFIDVSKYENEVLIFDVDGGSPNKSDNRLLTYDASETRVATYNDWGIPINSPVKYIRITIKNDPVLNGVTAYHLVRNEEKNYFKTEEVVSGSRNTNTGVIDTADIYASHIKFAVTPGEKYEIGHAWGIVYYDANDEYLSTNNVGWKELYGIITVPDGAAYMSVNTQNTHLSSGKSYVAKNENTTNIGELKCNV